MRIPKTSKLLPVLSRTKRKVRFFLYGSVIEPCAVTPARGFFFCPSGGRSACSRTRSPAWRRAFPYRSPVPSRDCTGDLQPSRHSVHDILLRFRGGETEAIIVPRDSSLRPPVARLGPPPHTLRSLPLKDDLRGPPAGTSRRPLLLRRQSLLQTFCPLVLRPRLEKDSACASFSHTKFRGRCGRSPMRFLLVSVILRSYRV